MLITDPKYGSELMTDKGKIYKFDSVECLAAYSFKNDPLNNWTKWVTDFYNPNNLINLKSAFFLKSQKLRSPMGLNLSAFSKEDHLQTIRNEFGGTKISWIELAKYVSEEWDEN
jgi:copper chaperone NosL